MKRSLKITILFITVTLLLNCGSPTFSSGVEEGNTSIAGVAYYPTGLLSSGDTVRLYSLTNSTFSDTTVTSNGNYHFSDLKYDTYRITISQYDSLGKMGKTFMSREIILDSITENDLDRVDTLSGLGAVRLHFPQDYLDLLTGEDILYIPGSDYFRNSTAGVTTCLCDSLPAGPIHQIRSRVMGTLLESVVPERAVTIIEGEVVDYTVIFENK